MSNHASSQIFGLAMAAVFVGMLILNAICIELIFFIESNRLGPKNACRFRQHRAHAGRR
jgi:hypothetical protein